MVIRGRGYTYALNRFRASPPSALHVGNSLGFPTAFHPKHGDTWNRYSYYRSGRDGGWCPVLSVKSRRFTCAERRQQFTCKLQQLRPVKSINLTVSKNVRRMCISTQSAVCIYAKCPLSIRRSTLYGPTSEFNYNDFHVLRGLAEVERKLLSGLIRLA